jgi:CheY-like chemotaxis protein
MRKIALVDDDVLMVDLLTTLLEMEGYQIVSPSIDDTLCDSLCQQNPDLILMDVCLRSDQGNTIDGLDLLEQLRQSDQLEDVKIIVSSGLDYRESSLAKGADDFLHKPYMPETLVTMINKAMQ